MSIESKFESIFDRIDAWVAAGPKKGDANHIVYEEDEHIECTFKPDLACYVFYRKAAPDKYSSIVYVTLTYRESTRDKKALEKTVVNYLKEKEGMQATFKSTGIQEAILTNTTVDKK